MIVVLRVQSLMRMTDAAETVEVKPRRIGGRMWLLFMKKNFNFTISKCIRRRCIWLNRRYSTSSVPSLRMGSSFWHNKAIPDLIPILQLQSTLYPTVVVPVLRLAAIGQVTASVSSASAGKVLRSTSPSWYRRDDMNQYRQRTYLHDLSVYAALIYSVSLNELEPRILRKRRRTTFWNFFHYIMSILCYVSLPRRCSLYTNSQFFIHDWMKLLR